jgi:hypothetical protein
MCSHKLGEYSESVIDCNKVLKHDPTNSKALYRRALAFVGLSDKSNKSQKLSVKKSQMELLSKARSDLKKLILKDPKNKTALKKLKEFESKILKNALIIKKLQAQEKENKKAEQERAAQQQQKAQPKKP